MSITYHLFRHAKAPKDRWRKHEVEYGFRRAVSAEGIRQGRRLRRCLGQRHIQPKLVLHSESPRAVVTAHLACHGFDVDYVPLKEFWTKENVLFGKNKLFPKLWAITQKYQFNMFGYMDDREALDIAGQYGGRVWCEIQEKVREAEMHDGDVVIFGHGVWNNFIAWSMTRYSRDRAALFPVLKECDELVVSGRNITHVPFQ